MHVRDPIPNASDAVKQIESEPSSTPDADVLKTLRQSAGFKPRTKVLMLLIILLSSSLAVVVAKRRMEGSDPKYSTQPCQRGDLVVTVTATGTLDPTNVVEIGCEVSGTILSVEVDFNDPVQEGDLLLTLDTSELQSEVARSEASLEVRAAELKQAAASLLESQRSLARMEILAKRNAVTQQDLDTSIAELARAEARVASSKAQVSVAQATLDVDRNRLRKSRIYAPIDGIVLLRNVEPGQTIAATFQTPVLLTLCEDLRTMKLKVDVDEADVGGVREGQVATFTVDAYPDEEFPAKIESLRFAAQNNQDVVTYEAVLEVENPQLKLRPGMTAVADIVTSSAQDRLLIPNAAIRFRPEAEEPSEVNLPKGQARVWVLGDDQKPASRIVSTGLTDGRFTAITGSKLKPDTPLIIDAAL